MSPLSIARAALLKFGSVKRLCEETGVKKSVAYSWFGKDAIEPGVGSLRKLCAALGIDGPPERPTGTKWCPDCESYLPLSRFYKNKSSNDGLAAYCASHIQRRTAESRSRTGYKPQQTSFGPSKAEPWRLTKAQYHEVRARQDYRCAVCRRHESEIRSNSKHRDRKLHMDHCHRTNRFRALLCPSCNHRVGIVEGNPSVLAATFSYVAKHAVANDGTLASTSVLPVGFNNVTTTSGE